MKKLVFYFRGEKYEVNESGQIKANGLNYFSPNWIFLGGSRHHWSNRINVSLRDAFEKPDLLNRCLGWDKDHGTTRQWGGFYLGKIPRITGAHIINQ